MKSIPGARRPESRDIEARTSRRWGAGTATARRRGQPKRVGSAGARILCLAATAALMCAACSPSTKQQQTSAQATADLFVRAASFGDAQGVCDLQVSAVGGHRVERDSPEWTECIKLVEAKVQALAENVNSRVEPRVVERRGEVRYSWGRVRIGIRNFNGSWLITTMDLT
jgi:hypothetical protein